MPRAMEFTLREGAIVGNADEIASPTVTHYQELAAIFIARVEDAFALLGELQYRHPLTEPFIRSNHTVPIEFIADVAAIVEDMPDLAIVKKFDPLEARDVLQFLQAFEPAANRVEILLSGLRYTMRAKKAKVADGALHVYHMAKLFGRRKEGAVFHDRAAVMRRSLGRAGKHRRAKKNSNL